MLNGFFLLFQVTFTGTIGSVGDVAGFHTERSHHIAFSFFFERSGTRFEFYRKITCPAGKSSSRGSKIDALVNGKVL